MFCPVCITAMVVANAPLITASVSGFVAAKVAYDQCRRRRMPVPKRKEVAKIVPVRVLKDLTDYYSLGNSRFPQHPIASETDKKQSC